MLINKFISINASICIGKMNCLNLTTLFWMINLVDFYFSAASSRIDPRVVGSKPLRRSSSVSQVNSVTV